MAYVTPMAATAPSPGVRKRRNRCTESTETGVRIPPKSAIGVLQLAEAVLDLPLGAIGDDHLVDPPLAPVGDEDALSEDLVLERWRASASMVKEGEKSFGPLPASAMRSTRASQRGRKISAISASTASRWPAALPTGESPGEVGELGGRLLEGLVKAPGLLSVELGGVGDDDAETTAEHLRSLSKALTPGRVASSTTR